jgi:hypothetical protein
MAVGALLAASKLALGSGAGASGAAGGISKLAGIGGGSGSGGGIGSKIGGLVKGAGGLGQLAQTGFAVGQMVAGAMNRKKAESMIPSLNQAEAQLFTSAKRRRRAIETGTAGSSDRAALKQTLAQFGQNSFRAGGPVNFGALNQLRAQAQSNISDQYAQQYNQAFADESRIAKDISNFYNDVAFLKSARTSARGEQQMQAGQQNLLATLGAGKLGKENASLKKQLAAYQNQGQ